MPLIKVVGAVYKRVGREMTEPGRRSKPVALTAAVLSAVASVTQLLGALITGIEIIPWSIAITTGGAFAIVGVEKLWRSDLRSRLKAGHVVLIITALLAGIGGYVAASAVKTSKMDGVRRENGVSRSAVPSTNSSILSAPLAPGSVPVSTSQKSFPGSVVISRTGGVGVEATVDLKVIAAPTSGTFALIVRYQSSDVYLYKLVAVISSEVGSSEVRYDISGSFNCSWRNFAVFYLPEDVSPIPGPTDNGTAELPPNVVNLTGWHSHQRNDDPSNRCR